jgi:hypothetical protein
MHLHWPDCSVRGACRERPPASWWQGALNGGLQSTGKHSVEQVFGRIFGYELAVDPTIHRGQCVVKSARHTSAHDGRLVDCPIHTADDTMSYQRLIDNRAERGMVLDLRVPIIGQRIPFVYRKFRPVDDRFKNINTEVELVSTEQVFSTEEQDQIQGFSRAIGLDIGELDVLRDGTDGKIYVVDVNPTPWGPPKPLLTMRSVHAVNAYAEELLQHLDGKIGSGMGLAST